MRIHEIGEFGLIDRLAARLAATDESVVVGIGDDAAVVSYAAGAHVVTTTDMLVEGVHFRRDTIGDRLLGWKAVAVSISDIAAMGGRPRHAVVSLAIPVETDVERVEELYIGMDEVCRAYDMHIVGGDVVKTDGPFVISVTVMGEVEVGRALLRSGARPGDLLFVTGTVGGSAAGLDYISQGGQTSAIAGQTSEAPSISSSTADALLRFHQRPVPQVRAGRLLLESGACTSLNDVSDGLSSESNEIAKISGVHLVIEGDKVPLHPSVTQYAAERGIDPLEWALFGGEDYQLVGTLDPTSADRASSLFAKEGLSLTVIGRVEAGHGVSLLRQGERQELTPKGFNHFRS
jgi:thiamine-monophosphate kinase